MSGSNRGILTALAGLALAFAFLFPLISDLSSVSAETEQDATYRADKYREDAETHIQRRCLRLTFPASDECARQAEQSARENQRVELDLAAQRMTAWWTQVMGVAALIGMALSAIGVWLVWTTFREAKRSADAAWRMTRFAYFDYAPWLSIAHEGLDSKPREENGEFRFHFYLRNRGKTYAQNTSVIMLLRNAVGEIQLHTGPMHGRPKEIPGQPHGGYGFPVAHNMAEVRSALGEAFQVDDDDWKLIFDIAYQDIWGGAWEAREVFSQDDGWLKSDEGGYHREKNGTQSPAPD